MGLIHFKVLQFGHLFLLAGFLLCYAVLGGILIGRLIGRWIEESRAPRVPDVIRKS